MAKKGSTSKKKSAKKSSKKKSRKISYKRTGKGRGSSGTALPGPETHGTGGGEP